MKTVKNLLLAVGFVLVMFTGTQAQDTNKPCNPDKSKLERATEISKNAREKASRVLRGVFGGRKKTEKKVDEKPCEPQKQDTTEQQVVSDEKVDEQGDSQQQEGSPFSDATPDNSTEAPKEQQANEQEVKEQSSPQKEDAKPSKANKSRVPKVTIFRDLKSIWGGKKKGQ